MRSFNPESLLTPQGESVISRLAQSCNYAIIEDADLGPRDLLSHLETFSLHFLTAQDITKALGLTRNYAYIIWAKSQKKQPSFLGNRIW